MEVAAGLALRARGHESRQPHELLVQLLRDHPRRALRLLHRPQRHGDVRAIGVVLGVGDLSARGQEQRERETAGERGPESGGEQPPHPRRTVPAHGERHDQPRREAEAENHHQKHAQVGRHRVARLLPHRLHVGQLAAGEPLGRLPVHGPHVDRQPRRQPHGAEARAPIHERDVQVERAAVERLHGQLDSAHAELALRAVRGEREQAPAENRDHDKGHRGSAADGPHRPQASGAPRGGYS